MGNLTDKEKTKLGKDLLKFLKNGDFGGAETCLIQGADANFCHSFPFLSSSSPAAVAIRRDDVDMLKLLIKYGLDLNKRISYSNYHMPPLMLCMQVKRLDTLKFLAENIDAKLNVSGTASYGGTFPRIIDITSVDKLSSRLNISEACKDIFERAQPIRAQKEQARKQQKIRNTKFRF